MAMGFRAVGASLIFVRRGLGLAGAPSSNAGRRNGSLPRPNNEAGGSLLTRPLEVSPSAPPAQAARSDALLRLRLQRSQFGLAAQGQDAHLARAVDRHDHLGLAIALIEGDVADFRAPHRQLERGPLVAARVVFDDLIRGPQIAPYVVVVVHRDMV